MKQGDLELNRSLSIDTSAPNSMYMQHGQIITT